MRPARRAADALRAMDGLLQSHLQETTVSGRALANLALAMATEYSGADRGALLIDEGAGLEPVLELGRDLQALPEDCGSLNAELVRRAASLGQIVVEGGSVAAPVVLGDTVRAMVVLESDDGGLDEEAREVAQGVATRIAVVLRSASLVDELARRTRNVETLEAVGACLSARQLGREQFERAVDAALQATESRQAALALPGVGKTWEYFFTGKDRDSLEALARRLAERPEDEDRREEILTGAGRPYLFELLRAEMLRLPSRSGTLGPPGFLLVRRLSQRAYQEADRSFFRALGHLLSGALARADYLRRAAEDPLTATGSRLALQLRLAETESRAVKNNEPFSLILLDIDQFKSINDRWGHLEGDAVLKEVADSLRARLRAHDFVARFGGDEFVIILPSTGVEEATRVAKALREVTVARTYGEKGNRISISFGLATFPIHVESYADLLRLADEALYSSKSGGRDRVTRVG